MIQITTFSPSVGNSGVSGDVDRNFGGWFHGAIHRFASVSFVWIILCLCTLCGCTMLKENVPLLKKSEKSAPVQRILTMWTFSSQEEPDGSTTPGFVGKVLFFAAGSDKPISATGQIEIHVYEQQGDEWRLRRKFVSEPDVWKHNERQTALGTVYDVFVPHETAKNQKYSLVLKYRSATGQMVSSPHAQLP
jgi:hypothetical protein